MSNEEILKAFHLMWDNFPEAVMATQRSREIIAVNKKAAEFGLKAGIKCSSIGAPEKTRVNFFVEAMPAPLKPLLLQI